MKWADVTSGILQGSVLGQLLFLIYRNGLPDVVHSFKLFANDAKLYAVVNTARDATVVQNDLGSLDNWSEIWQINFNYDKCTHMHLGKDQEFSMYFMTQWSTCYNQPSYGTEGVRSYHPQQIKICIAFSGKYG